MSKLMIIKYPEEMQDNATERFEYGNEFLILKRKKTKADVLRLDTSSVLCKMEGFIKLISRLLL